MVLSMAATLLTLIFVTGLQSPTSVVSAVNANVSQAVVYTNYGDDAEILCFAPEEAVRQLPPGERLCRYYHIDETDSRNIIINATEYAISEQQGPGVYEYVGTGVNNGQCGLKIVAATLEQVGDWVCSFLAAGTIWRAEIEVLQYEKPDPPIIIVDGFKNEINVTDLQDETIAQNETNILCCSSGGKPIAETKLAFYLDEKVISDFVLKKNDSASTCIQWAETFTKEFNDQIFVCRVSHPGFKDVEQDSEEVQYSITVNVEYSPEIVYSSNDGTFIAKRVYNENNQVDVHFTVKGNPIPSVDMKKNVTNSDDYKLEDVHIKNVTVHSERNSNEFIVTIDAPNETEGDLMLQITVENILGKDVGVAIVTPPPGDDNGSTTWILIAIGIVMSVIFIAIIVCVINNEAKNRGWCGYEARKEKYKIKKVANSTPARDTQEYSAVANLEESRF